MKLIKPPCVLEQGIETFVYSYLNNLNTLNHDYIYFSKMVRTEYSIIYNSIFDRENYNLVNKLNDGALPVAVISQIIDYLVCLKDSRNSARSLLIYLCQKNISNKGDNESKDLLKTILKKQEDLFTDGLIDYFKKKQQKIEIKKLLFLKSEKLYMCDYIDNLKAELDSLEMYTNTLLNVRIKDTSSDYTVY